MWFFAANPFGINANDIGIPTSTSTIAGGITGAIGLLIQIVGMLSVVVLIFGGIQFAASQGNPKMIQQAKDTILYAVVGIVVSVIAFTVVYTFAAYTA